MARKEAKQKSSLFSVFFTFAVDNLGATIVFPIFAPLFLEPSKGLLGPDISHSYKTIFLGFFLGIYPLMQFIFAPILGEYADHHGRKRALLLTTFLTCIGYALSVFGIHHHSLFWIFFARLMMGVGAGNLSICLSALSDLSPGTKKKIRYYSYGSAIAGLTFILGPFVGGKLSDPSISPAFDSSFPLFIGAILGLINVLFILFAFAETIKTPSNKPFDLIKGIHSIQTALRTKSIRLLYLLYFFFLFSWNIIFLFVPAFVVDNFHLSNATIGDICAFLGVCWIFGTGVLHRIFYHVADPKWILLTSFFLFSALVVFIPYSRSLKGFLLLLGSCTLLSGLVWPICTSVISNAAPDYSQGKVLGLSQSMLSTAMVLSSILGGFFLHAHSLIPFVFSSLSSLVAAALVLKIKIE
ncbi:MAG: MFS transporter [Simkaniaceae bacterium]|nr:MFS transporter [Simkaniaceae bacterium]